MLSRLLTGVLIKRLSPILASLNTFPKRLLAILVLGLFIGLAVVTTYRAIYAESHRSDFTVFIAAGQAVQAGTDIYAAHNPRGWLYVYPPPFALICAVLAWMPVGVSAVLWYLMSLFWLMWSLHLCVTTIAGKTPPGENRFWLYFLPFLMIIPAFIQNAAEGQTSILMLWLVTGAICWKLEGKEVRAAFCLAGAILLKFFPAALLAYYLWRRQWRFVAWTLIAILVGGLLFPMTFFGGSRTLDYWQKWGTIVAHPSLSNHNIRAASQLNGQLLSHGKRDNQALPAILWRLTQRDASQYVANALGLVMAAGMIWVAGWHRRHNELWIIAVFLAWLLLILPISQLHYHLLLLLPMTLLVHRSAWQILIGYAVATLVTLPWSAAQVAGVLGWAMLALWGALLVLAAKTKRPV